MPDQSGAYTIDKGISTVGCEKSDLLDIGGVARTGEDGTVEFNLKDVWCPGRRASTFGEHANLIATPRSQVPVLLTAHASPEGLDGVKIKVMSWKPDGSPAPRVEFDWRCRVPRKAVSPGEVGAGPLERG
jgi:hypothetical protein